jgi:hypothetical protein
MRTLVFSSLWLGCVTALMVGCGGDGEPEVVTGTGGGFGAGGSAGGASGGVGNLGGSGLGGGSGSAGAGATAGFAGAAAGGAVDASVDVKDAGIPDVVFSYDGPVDSGFGDACAETTVTAKLKSLDMYVMLDRSGSMSEPGFAWYADASDCNVGSAVVDSKWCRAVNALGQYFQSSAATNNRAALQYFPRQGVSTCPGAGYGTPAVGLSALPSAANGALIASLNLEAPKGTYTPTHDAILGLNGFTAGAKTTGREMISILITDGKPNSCPVNTDSGLAGILTAHFNATGIPTYVIGMTGASFANLEVTAKGGGTKSHPDQVGTLSDTCGDGPGPCNHWNVGNGDPNVFVEALKAIQQQAVGCSMTIPKPSQGAPDWNQVKVEYSAGGTPPALLIPKVSGAAQCAGDGWYYDNNTSPTQVNLCPTLCNKVQADAQAKIDLLLGCLGS